MFFKVELRFTQIWTKMFKTLQDRYDNGNYYKNEDQRVGSTILDSKTGGLVAISGGRNFKDVVDNNSATDAHLTGSSLKPFLAYGPLLKTCNGLRIMQFKTNQAIQLMVVHSVTMMEMDMVL